MVSGWVDYENDTYYCGTENEGWAYTGWQYLEPDDDLNSSDYDDQDGSTSSPLVRQEKMLLGIARADTTHLMIMVL